MPDLTKEAVAYGAGDEIDSSLNVPISPPPRKDRKITFRVLEKTYSILEGMSKTSKMPLSEFMNQVSLQYINYVVTLHDIARHYYRCGPGEQRRILEHESTIPPPARQFAMALQAYPDKERFIGKGAGE